MGLIRKLIRPIKNILLDKRAAYYLKKVSERKHDKSKPLKVGFIVFEPETWDKLEPVYRELLKCNNTIVEFIVVPSFDRGLRITTEYGEELEFFKKIDSNCILAFDNGSWIDISNRGYDYIFYQDPYNAHMPQLLRSDYIVKYAQICYIPYGFSGSDVFMAGSTNADFFRNVSYAFMDTEKFNEVLLSRFDNNVKSGLQHFEMKGYPAFSNYFSENVKYKNISTILWTPRWSYDTKVGGSHFLEYMYEYLKLSDKFPNVKFIIRPHPMMFRNFINSKLMTEVQVDEYLDEAKKHNVVLSTTSDLKKEFENADLLITDYSSIIPMFFFTGKPLIYCKSNIKFNKEFNQISKGIYMTDTWEEVTENVIELLHGHHKLYRQQELITANFKAVHENSSEKIVGYLYSKYKNKEIN